MDAATTDGLNRGIDVLLVFTGLFSAVLTTFIIQSYQQMLPDPAETTNALLSQLIAELRSSSVLNITGAEIISATTGSEPTSREIRWVNGLWFAALSCSLSAALVSMFAKQWIQPKPNVSGSPRYRARQRQRWYTQLQDWHVFVVINGLPLLLHVALLLFFAGIIVLLWSGDVAIMAATFTIVALAYIFYVGSMWMSLVYPECPYQHPISEQLRLWMARSFNPPQRLSSTDLEYGATSMKRPQSMRVPLAPSKVDPEDQTDASALLWLLQQCSSDDLVATTLQAIGGLPRNFSAFHILREAGVIPMVLQHFSCCFRRDVSFDTHWDVINHNAAEKYCRSWMRLTHGTSEEWPRDLRAPLNALKCIDGNLHVSLIAACAIALNSLDSRTPQLALISYLHEFANGESNVDELTQRWLLDTFLECILSWELHAAVVNDLTKRAVPVLLQLLQQASDRQSSHRRSTIALILRFLTVGSVDSTFLWDEEQRQQGFHNIIIPSLAAIVMDTENYGVKDELLNFTTSEFSRLVAPVFTRSSNFPSTIKNIARSGLSKLYLDGRIDVGLIPDCDLADILQILHPLPVAPEQHPWFVKTLLRTLTTSTHVSVAIAAIRLLEPLITDCDSTVLGVFTEENGIAALLRAANTGDTDSRRLQIDCIRALCVFIRSSTSLSQPLGMEKQFDIIFESEFFTTLIAVVGARRWWLAEIVAIWLPSMLRLCVIRPEEQIWRSVEGVFRHFAELNVEEDGYQRMLDDLDQMNQIIMGARTTKE
ncbi:hypothetical protein M413DRAFT_341491 [Hebeloma cylindrosporum]|uniref:DUF6535 domain-containing protein n=1 Tax=Hebeloma cylindrosporum TaxID=76867 RepID=A0A0C3C9G0_HEBCY|nr:hypothetical protein M413DRAFT_341491 [Hebeloma cylindrosporum h7]